MAKRLHSDNIEWTLELNMQEFIRNLEKSGKSINRLQETLKFAGDDFEELQQRVSKPIESMVDLVNVMTEFSDLNFGLDDTDFSKLRDLISEQRVIIEQNERITALSQDNFDISSQIVEQEERITSFQERLSSNLKSFLNGNDSFGSIFLKLRENQQFLRQFVREKDPFGINLALQNIKNLYSLIDITQLRQIFTKSGKFDREQAFHQEKTRHNLEEAKLYTKRGEMNDAEFELAKTQELLRYQEDVYDRLLELRDTPGIVANQVEMIDVELSKSLKMLADYNDQLGTALANVESKSLEMQVESNNAFYDNLELSLSEHLSEDVNLQDQYSILLKELQLNRNKDLLKLHEEYYNTIEQMEGLSSNQRKELLLAEDKTIRKLKQEQLKYLIAIEKQIELMTSEPIGLDGLRRNLEKEILAVQSAYDAMIEISRQNGLEIELLEKSKLQKLRDLEFEYQQELWGIKERLGVNWQEEYEHEVSLFRKMLDDELISQSQFEKKLFELRVLNAKKWFDYYHGLSGSMFSAIQQAEIDQSDAKYDVLIRQAENAGEDTAALEEEKENKKLEIQKKYADVDFAIKASQIVADTAVAIMKTWAQLGWPAGAIGAAFIAATGAAQLISAKAERDRIKNLQPRNSDFSNEIPSAERVLSGYSEGGYTGDGRRLEVAGIVHKGEYVVPQPIMGDPRVVDAVGMIEAIRRHRKVNMLSMLSHGPRDNAAGFAEGGYTGITADFTDFTEVVKELRKALDSVKHQKAYVVYQDIEKAGEVLNRARSPFTRKS